MTLIQPAGRCAAIGKRWVWVVMVLLCTALMVQGQEPKPEANGEVKSIKLPLHESAIVEAPWPIKHLSVTDSKIAIIQKQDLSPQKAVVEGKSLGSTDLVMWSENGEIRRFRIDVIVNLGGMKDELRKLFPKSNIELTQSHDVVLVSGTLARAEHAEQLHKYLDATALKYVDLTSVAGVQQVLLKVKVAEVSRTAIRALGVNAFIGGHDAFGGITIGPSQGGPINPLGVDFTAVRPGRLGATDLSQAVTVFAGFPQSDLFIFVQALAENQYLRLLAEPNLVALSGEEATFLAGGEIPIPVVQGAVGGASSGTSISIEYKEFGIRLKFRPIVLGDNSIRLKVAPEVSELTSSGAVVLQGFAIPALVTRKAETTLELKSGQSFAMAGLINHKDQADNSRVPGVGDVPVLGALFRSTRYQSDDTELVILVTADLVEPLSTAVTPPLPGSSLMRPNDWEFYALGILEGSGMKPPCCCSKWMKDRGMHRLKGPGAWEGAEDGPARSQANNRAPQIAATTMPASE